MAQQEINDTEWRNPENWRGGILFPIYYSPRDSRLMVGAFRWWPIAARGKLPRVRALVPKGGTIISQVARAPAPDSRSN